MSRLKVFASVLFALGFAGVAHAFSLLGPWEEWQTERIGYFHQDRGMIGGPMNIGSEYRWNIPVITYGFDESFLNYFGSNGVAAVDQAFQILNDLPAASTITPEMVSANSEAFPPFSIAQNAQARALNLIDIKSVMLHYLLEEMGLASPDFFVYCLRSRTTHSNPDFTNWVVIQRNFDPVTFEPSAYVNDVLYVYDDIIRGKNPDIDLPNIIQVSLQPNALPVASFLGLGGLTASSGSSGYGLYYSGTNAASALTRDDVGGLRYMLRTNNLNVEGLLPSITEIVTNKSNPILLTNYDLSLLIRASRGTTNTPAEISALFPGIAFTSTNTYFSNVVSTNVTSFFTNFPYALGENLDAAENHIYVTNYVTNVVQVFDYSFGNLMVNAATQNRIMDTRVITTTPAEDFTPGGGTIRTNITVVHGTTNMDGSFYIIPTNFLSFDIITNTEIGVSETTNIISSYFSALVAVTNTNAAIPLTTYDLHEFLVNTRNTTNTLAQVLTNYPGALVTASTNSRLGVVAATNVVSYFTNYPFNPTQVFVTNITYSVVTNYDYDIANVVSNPISIYSEREFLPDNIISPDYVAYDESRPVTIQEFEVLPGGMYFPGSSNSFQTNFSYISNSFETAAITNWFGEQIKYAFGECFIVPTNDNVVGYSYLSTLVTNVTAKTNIDYLVFSDMIVQTNTNLLDLTLTFDLTTFSEESRTNDPDALLTLHPDLLILASNRYFTNIVSSNFTLIFTNSAWDPAGTLVLTQQWFYTTNVETNWSYTFGNVVTNFGMQDWVDSNAMLIIEQEIVGTKPYDPAGTPATTNVVVTTVTTNNPVGNIYIVPTNYFGHPLFGWSIQSTQLVDVVAVTNTLVFTNTSTSLAGTILQTNTTRLIRYETNYLLNVYPVEIVSSNEVATNIFGKRREIITYSTNTTFEVYPIQMLTTNELGTNTFGQRTEIVTYFTNSVLLVNPVESQSPSINVGLRAGVDKITFVRANYDSLAGTNLVFTNSLRLGLTNIVFTNDIAFTNTVIVSNTAINQLLHRRLDRPDIIISAGDLGTYANTGEPVQMRRTDTGNWINNSGINGQGNFGDNSGPGIIVPPIDIVFSRVGPYYDNEQFGNQFLQDGSAAYHWASYDSSTNIVVYPTGSTIQDLENQILTP